MIGEKWEVGGRYLVYRVAWERRVREITVRELAPSGKRMLVEFRNGNQSWVDADWIIAERLEALEGEPTPTDTPTPEPGEPKVVGHVTDGFAAGRFDFSQVVRHRGPEYPHSLILQSEHEAAVQRLRERLGEAENMYRNRDGRLEEAKDEITRLKAENERLVRDMNDNHARAEEIIGAREEHIRELRAERDAYADPGNWRVCATTTAHDVVEKTYQYTQKPHPTRLYDALTNALSSLAVHYIGPTPSDSTEGESVEGRFMLRSMGAWGVMGACVSPDWPHGTPVKITRIPTPGGDDGE